MCLEDSLMSYQCGVSSLYFMSAVSNAVGSVSVGRSKIQCSSTLAAFIPLQYTYTQTSIDNKANSKESTSKVISWGNKSWHGLNDERWVLAELEDLVTNVMDLSDSEKRKHADTKPSCEQKAFHPLRFFFGRVTWGNTENILKSWVDFPGAQLLPFFGTYLSWAILRQVNLLAIAEEAVVMSRMAVDKAIKKRQNDQSIPVTNPTHLGWIFEPVATVGTRLKKTCAVVSRPISLW